MQNIQTLTIDMNKKLFGTVTANVGEVASRFLRIKIVDNGLALDLTNITVYLYANKIDGTKIFNTVTIEDATNGIVLAELTSQILAVAGIVKLTLLLTEGGSKLCTKIFNLKVDESIVDDAAIESTNEFTALTEALNSVQNIDNKFEEVDAQFNTIEQEINSLKDSTFESFEIYEPPTASNEWTTDGGGKILNVSSDQFYTLFYDNYIGISDYGTVTKTSLGKDESGLYDLYEYDFCPKNYSRTILLSSGMHTYELSAHFGCAHFIKHIMDTSIQHEGYKYIRENVRIKIIPIINPWGWNQSPKKYGNSNGVNINRNFDYDNKWSTFPVYSANPSDSNYNEWNVKGSAPFSESETQIVRDWVLANNTAEFWIDCHNGLGLGPYDNFIYYTSDCIYKDKIISALNKLTERITTKYNKSTSTNNVVVDSEGSIRHHFSNHTAGIPTMTVEQTPNNLLWGTYLNNESGDIENYEVCLSTYVQEFLLQDKNSDNIDASIFATKDDINSTNTKIRTINSNIPFLFEKITKTNYESLAEKISTKVYFVEGYGVYIGTACIISTDNLEGGGSVVNPPNTVASLMASVNLANGNVIDTSGNNNNAIISGAYVTDTDSVIFNGADGIIDTGLKLLQNGETEFTLKYRAKYTSIDSVARYFFSIGTTGAVNLFCNFIGTDFYEIKHVVNSVATFNFGNSLISELPKFNINANTIYDFAITYDGTTIKFYIDGVLKNSKDVNLTFLNVNLVLGNTTNLNRGLIGSIYSYEVYNKALSDIEIISI